MSFDITEYGKEIFDIEISELEKVKNNINSEFSDIVNLINECSGKVIVTGVGKSGIIGKKISSTLASTGTYSVFMHATEGLHGDLGMINRNDVVLAISNSGNTDEVISIMPSIKKIGAKVIAMTGNSNSTLAQVADHILYIHVEREACPMNLAPTCTSTAALVMGDAIASSLIKLKEFKPENFALFHPGGSLGRRLLIKIKDIMIPLKNCSICRSDDLIDKVIIDMTAKCLGATCILDENNQLKGLITDGDLRRHMQDKTKFFSYKAKDIMTVDPLVIDENEMAIDAMDMMERRVSRLSVLPVVNTEKILVGLVRIHDLLF
ncbi:MAG: KpsF/GutQ family sugar-phosphate isomerase [bacterium]|nr:KpsF/GutQ family sugar-phosphate isomerase [bacterium]